ncbi:MAG: hypothetical protein ABIG61_10515 [Planctomycetota bacterium]
MITAVFFATAMGNTLYLSYLPAAPKEKTAPRNRQLITSGFENAVSVAIVSRNDQISRKVTNPTGWTKPAFMASDYLSAKNRLLHSGNFESSNVAVNGINEPSLISLHCLLIV